MLSLALAVSFGALPANAIAAQRSGRQNSKANTKELSEAASLLESGRLEEAEAAARKIITARPRDPEAYILLGVILDQLGLSADAEGAYHAALKLQPNSVPALSNLGVLLARTDRKEEAIKRFEQVLRLDPNHPKAVFNLGALYAARGNYDRAIPLLERAAGVTGGKISKQETTDPALLLTLVNAYAHARQRDEALKLATQLEQIAGDHAPTLFTLGLSLAEAHEYSAALRLFERTNVLRPQTYEVLYNLGLAFYNLDRLDEAARAMSEAATLQPTAPDPYYRLGLITSAQGDTKSALEFFLKAIELRANLVPNSRWLTPICPLRYVTFGVDIEVVWLQTPRSQVHEVAAPHRLL